MTRVIKTFPMVKAIQQASYAFSWGWKDNKSHSLSWGRNTEQCCNQVHSVGLHHIGQLEPIHRPSCRRSMAWVFSAMMVLKEVEYSRSRLNPLHMCKCQAGRTHSYCIGGWWLEWQRRRCCKRGRLRGWWVRNAWLPLMSGVLDIWMLFGLLKIRSLWVEDEFCWCVCWKKHLKGWKIFYTFASLFDIH